MTVRQLIDYLECLPVEVKEGQTTDEALLESEVLIRIPLSSGQHTATTHPEKIYLEKIERDDEKSAIIITTGLVYDFS